MKTRFVIFGLLVAHATALLLLAGWMWWDGRLDRQRVERVVEIFSVSVEEERQIAAERQRAEDEAKAKLSEVARLESVADGPLTLGDRLRTEQQVSELALQRVERLQRETTDLRRQLTVAKDLVTRQRKELDDERKNFEAVLAEHRTMAESENFQRAVQTYEQLKPRQVKEMFQALLDAGREGEVVDYLAAMQIRKSSGVLKEFKTPEEIVQAMQLVERLRARGVDPLMEIPRDSESRT